MRSTCCGCGRVFGGVWAFDMHRTGSYSKRERCCMAVTAMAHVGLTQNDKGIWCRDVSPSLAQAKNSIVDGVEVPA